MKVRCTRILDERTGEVEEHSHWLTVGDAYEVLAFSFRPDGRVKVRLLGKQKDTPALFDIHQFDIINAAIPSGWVLLSYPDSSFELCPKSWAQPGFWNNFFDGDSEARRVFDEERRKIIDFEKGGPGLKLL
jgi:hypothetical protein